MSYKKRFEMTEAELEAVRARDRAYYETHKEQVVAKQKRWNEKNWERVYEHMKAYQKTPGGRAKVKAASKRYYITHREEILAKQKQYYEANKKRLLAYRKGYDAGKKKGIALVKKALEEVLLRK